MPTTDANYAYYSLRPLCTEMVKNPSVPIRSYTSGVGLGDTNLVAIVADMEDMARTFLEAMDQVIAPFANNNVIPPTAFSRILRAKETLVAAIPVGIINIEGKDVEAELAHVAAKAIERALSKSLAKGFNTAAIAIERDTQEATLHNSGAVASGIPLAVRSVPSAVQLKDQSVVTTYPEAVTPAEAAQCKYSLSWFYEGISTDAIWISMMDTLSAGDSVYLSDKLFYGLAQFRVVHAALMADIPAVYTSADAGNKTVLAAYNAFAEIAEAIAAAWLTFVAPVLPAPVTGKGPYYALQVTHTDGYLQSATLNVLDAGLQHPVLPALFAKNVNGKLEQLPMTANADGTYTYAYEGRDESDGCSILAEFVCTDIYCRQPVFGATVARNWTTQVNTELVYANAVSFPTPVDVRIVQTERMDIDTSGHPTSEAVVAFFRSLLGDAVSVPDTQIVVTYTYPMATAGLPWISVPVLMAPKEIYTDELINKLVRSAYDWRDTAQPPGDGHFAMNVTMYGVTGEPVLVLHEVTFS